MRSDAEEILEGTLLKCKNEHEEKKAEYISGIFANTSFDPQVDLKIANHLLRTAEQLTFLQLTLVALVRRQDEMGADLKEYWRGGWENADHMTYQVARRELLELGSEGHYLMSFSGGPTSFVRPYLTSLGKSLYELMDLDKMPKEEILETWTILRAIDPTSFD